MSDDYSGIAGINFLPLELLDLILSKVGLLDRRVLVLSSSEPSSDSVRFIPKGQKTPYTPLLPRQGASRGGSPASSRKQSPKPPLSRALNASGSPPTLHFRLWTEPLALRLRLVCTSWRAAVDSALHLNVRWVNLSEVLSVPTLALSFDVLVKSIEDHLFNWSQLRVLELSHLGDWSVLLPQQLKALPIICPKIERLFLTHCSRGVEADLFTTIIKRLTLLRELFLTETPLQTSCQTSEVVLSLPRSLTFIEISYWENSSPLSARINFGLLVRRMRPDIMLSVVSGGHNPYGFCKALIISESFNTRASHLEAHTNRLRNFIIQSLTDRRFDIFQEIVKHMSPSTRQFWREKFTYLVNSKENWSILVNSGLFAPVDILWALFWEHFSADLTPSISSSHLTDFLSFFPHFFSIFNIDASEFISPVFGLSLVGLVAKANLPFKESVGILLNSKILFRLPKNPNSKLSSSSDSELKIRNKELMLNSLEKETRYSALYYAIIGGDLDLFRLLVDLGADINVSDCKGHSVLFHCISWRTFEWIEILLDRNVFIDWDSLWLAFSRQSSLRAQLFSQIEGTFVFDQDGDDKNKLLELLFSKCSEEVLVIVDRDGKSFVEKAAVDHCISLITLFNRPGGERLYSKSLPVLLCRNFSKHLSLFGEKVFTCFELVAKYHSTRDSLLSIPCLLYALESFSLTHFWTFSVAPKVIRFFTSFGFNINLQDEGGRTVLHWAYSTGKEKLIALCLELGADESLADKNGNLPNQNRRVAKKWQSVKLSGSFK